MPALMTHTLICTAYALLAYFMMGAKETYFNPRNPTLMTVTGMAIIVAILIHKNAEAPYLRAMKRGRTVGEESYFFSTLALIMVINGAFDTGFSSEPVRLLVVGVGYLGLKHLMKARVIYEQLGLNPR